MELIIDILAPVSIRALTRTPSTSTSSKFRLVVFVNRGFSGRVGHAASPPGAAVASFPERCVRKKSAAKGGEVAANEIGDVVGTGSGQGDCCGSCRGHTGVEYQWGIE